MNPMSSFLALDFETADQGRDSACAIGLVRVESGQIVGQQSWLIRPPRPQVFFTHIHGITWSMVRHAPTFAELWPELAPWFVGTDFLAAHNASFDRSVLRACCATAAVPMPAPPFVCTVQLARTTWNLYPTKLPDVARHLGLTLRHHDALSDAEACARIVLAAQPPLSAPTRNTSAPSGTAAPRSSSRSSPT